MNYSAEVEDKINLLELFQVLIKNKKLLITIPLLVALASAGGSLLMKNIYHAEVLVTAAQSGDAKSGLSSALGGLSGLASTPDKKVKPKRAMIVVVSTLVSLILTILWIFIREGYRKQKELNQETLAHGASSSSTTLAE